MDSYLKRSLKLFTTHLLTIVFAVFVMAVFSWCLKSDMGMKIVWGVVFLIYFGMIYSDGWNMAAFDSKPYNSIKPNPARAALAYLPQLIIPLIIVVINFTPIDSWRPFSQNENLKADKQYTVVLHGTAGTYADDIRIVKMPKDKDNMQEYMTAKDVNQNGGFEKDGEWTLSGGAKIVSDMKHEGEKSLFFDSDGTAELTFTAPEEGEYYFGGYCRSGGELTFEIKDIASFNATKLTTPLNQLIFRIAGAVWYMPLSLLYNLDGNGIQPSDIAYLIFVLPLIAVIGYIVGTTGFSVLDKYAAYKNKRLKKQKQAAEDEKKAIREQMRRYKK